MTSKIGYRLPAGDAYTDEVSCQLVYLPNKDEYWRALLGALDYMGTWAAWERDADKKGKDAARAWSEANEQTWECWRMACLEQLQDDVSAIRLLLQQRACCDNVSVTYAPTTIVTTTIIPGVGDDPTVYGETAVSDWEEWLEHLCFQSHEYVDKLIHWGETIDALQSAGGLTLDAWSQILGWMQFAGIVVPVFLGDLMGWLSDFLLDVTSGWFDSVAADLEAARGEIVCAIRFDTDVAQVVEDALGDTSLAWLLFYGLINYDSVKATLYEGGVDGDFLPTETRDDCDCEVTPLFEYVWVEPDKQEWLNSVFWESGNLRFTAAASGIDSRCHSYDTVSELETRFTITAPLVVNYVSFDFYFWQGTAPMRYVYFYPQIVHLGGAANCPIVYLSSYSVNQWYSFEWHIGADITIDPGAGTPLGVYLRKTSSTPSNQGVFLQNLKFALLD